MFSSPIIRVFGRMTHTVYAVYFVFNMRTTREHAHIYTDNIFYIAGCGWLRFYFWCLMSRNNCVNELKYMQTSSAERLCIKRCDPVKNSVRLAAPTQQGLVNVVM